MKNKILDFKKYQACGNDFIVVDDRNQEYADLNQEIISHLCDRRFGIGADGFMRLVEAPKQAGYKYGMYYYNSDGQLGSMCGNGGRCFASLLSEIESRCGTFSFCSNHKIYHAELLSSQDGNYSVCLQMPDIYSYQIDPFFFFVDTGSPHVVIFLNNIHLDHFEDLAKEIRYSANFPQGVNVNIVKQTPFGLQARTYERGVEAETYACGTGAVAMAIAYWRYQKMKEGRHHLSVYAKGGLLQVSADIRYKKEKDQKQETAWSYTLKSNFINSDIKDFIEFNSMDFLNICLEGPARKVYEGKTIL